MYSASLILVSTTLMFCAYLSFIPDRNTPNLHYCNKCAHGMSCHDDSFVLSYNLIRTLKWVKKLLCKSEVKEWKGPQYKWHLANMHVLGCIFLVQAHAWVSQCKFWDTDSLLPLSANHIFSRVLDHHSYYTLIMPWRCGILDWFLGAESTQSFIQVILNHTILHYPL